MSRMTPKDDSRQARHPERVHHSKKLRSGFSPVGKANEGENPYFDVRTVVPDSRTISPSFLVVVLIRFSWILVFATCRRARAQEDVDR